MQALGFPCYHGDISTTDSPWMCLCPEAEERGEDQSGSGHYTETHMSTGSEETALISTESFREFLLTVV